MLKRAADESLRLLEESRDGLNTGQHETAGLFMGRIRIPHSPLLRDCSSTERSSTEVYLARLRAFLELRVDAEKIDTTGRIPAEVISGLADLGAFGMKIPVKYGGLELSQTDYNRAMSTVFAHCSSTGALLSAHQSIGAPQPLLLFGTESQKETFLPRLARGAISAFALTEPEAGSDPARIKSTATAIEDGTAYLLNGTKIWCTNGSIANILVVIARLDSGAITAFLVENSMPGFEVAQRCRFAGMSAIENAVLKLNNVRVPRENIIGLPGQGLKVALATLNSGRLSLASGCIGAARQCVSMSAKWAGERIQWGRAIGHHEAIALKLASMVASLEAMEATTSLTTRLIDEKRADVRLETAMLKVFASEHMQRIANDAVQIRGGRGYERSASLRARGEMPFPAERILRDARVNTIIEGSSEILRLFIAREGLDRHIRLTSGIFDSGAPPAVRLTAVLKSLTFYSWWYPWQWLAPLFKRFTPSSRFDYRLRAHARFVLCESHRLARAAFHLMLRHGPGLQNRQLQLARLVDIGIDLFAMAASIGAAPNNDSNKVETIDVFCRDARQRIRSNFRLLRKNHDRVYRRLAGTLMEVTHANQ